MWWIYAKLRGRNERVYVGVIKAPNKQQALGLAEERWPQYYDHEAYEVANGPPTVEIE